MSNLQNFRKLFTRPVHCANPFAPTRKFEPSKWTVLIFSKKGRKDAPECPAPYIYAFFPKKIIYNKKHGTRKNS